MLKQSERIQIISFFHSLQSTNGGFSDRNNAFVSLQPTLSALKAFQFFGTQPPKPDAIFSYIENLHDAATGGFTDIASGKATVFSTALGLLILYNIHALEAFHKYLPSALKFMTDNAAIREEHFMLIGLIDECNIPVVPSVSIAFFRSMEMDDGTFGTSVLNNAIASGALLRAGEKLEDEQAVTALLLSGQRPDGGFGDKPETSDLWTSYCVMRALDLLKCSPKVIPLYKWIMKMYAAQGGFSTDQSEPSANVSYQALSVLNWITSPLTRAAQSGNIDVLSTWLHEGGSPDVENLEGWSPLMIASVRGQAEVVKFLLSDDIPGGKKANLNHRLENADALPIFWAGQSGDLETVKTILKYDFEQLFVISKVNGHTLLLQLAFFGSEKHLKTAEWVLGNIAEILGIPDNDFTTIENARIRLLSATNVRGYSCLSMSRLWNNRPMEALFAKFDKSTDQQKQEYYKNLLKIIAIPVPPDENERKKQQLTDRCIETITDGFVKLSDLNPDDNKAFETAQSEIIKALFSIISNPLFDINRLGGPLSQTPLIAALTGVNTNSQIAGFREKIVLILLEYDADPDKPEKHPMAVDAVIRASVLNHFEILQLLSKNMKPLAFAAALNEKPAINGQTALQDTVHRALTSSGEILSSHLEQIKWSVSKGANPDIEDHTGTSPKMLALKALNDSVFHNQATRVIEALKINSN